MATEFQTSFIPKQTGTTTPGNHPHAAANFAFIVSLVIFLGVIAFTAGVIVWAKFTDDRIASLDVELERSQEQYDRAFIEEAARLNTRIEVGKTLIKNHVAISELFRFLEERTTNEVSLSSLNFSTDPDGTMRMSATGVATGYPAIVAQSDSYGEASYVRDLIFSGLNANNSGLIQFSLSAKIDPQLVDYEAIVAQPADRTSDVEVIKVGTSSAASNQPAVMIVGSSSASTKTPVTGTATTTKP